MPDAKQYTGVLDMPRCPKCERYNAMLLHQTHPSVIHRCRDCGFEETGEEQRERLRRCRCEGENSWWEHDAKDIPLCRVCGQCRDVKLAQYRPEILTGYTQADVDEPIEEE